MDVGRRSRGPLHRVLALAIGTVAVTTLLACQPAPRAGAPAAGATGSAPAAAPASTAPQSAAANPAAQAPAASGAATAAQPAALNPPVKIKIAYSELTSAQGPNWVAQEAGIYAKYGLDTEQLYIQSAQTVAAVVAGEVEVALGGGAAAINSRLGGSDLTIFMALTNYYPYELFVSNDIVTPNDLRGKTIGISRFGSSSDVATRLALQHFGIDADRDVTLIQVGSLAERMAAMRTGQLAAAVASPPYNTTLRRMGQRSILDLAKMGEPALNNVGFTKASWLKENPAVAQAFVNAIVEAIHFSKTNREFTERTLAQYLKLDDLEAIADSYDYYMGENLGRLPDVSFEATRKYLESIAPTDPRAVNARPADFLDTTFLERAKASGLIERLYGNN